MTNRKKRRTFNFRQPIGPVGALFCGPTISHSSHKMQSDFATTSIISSIGKIHRMIKALFISLVFVLSGVQGQLRGVVRQQQNALSLPDGELDHSERELFVCSAIENLFKDKITCKCDLRPLFGVVGFDCTNVDEVCAGGLCFKPSYAGSFSFQIFLSNYSFTGKVCANDVSKSDAPPLLGDIDLGKFCIEAGYQVKRAEGGEIQTGINKCSAEAFGVKCNSCKSCTLSDGSTGVSLGCNNVNVKTCVPLNLPLSDASPTVSGENFFDGIDVSGLATELSEQAAENKDNSGTNAQKQSVNVQEEGEDNTKEKDKKKVDKETKKAAKKEKGDKEKKKKGMK